MEKMKKNNEFFKVNKFNIIFPKCSYFGAEIEYPCDVTIINPQNLLLCTFMLNNLELVAQYESEFIFLNIMKKKDLSNKENTFVLQSTTNTDLIKDIYIFNSNEK